MGDWARFWAVDLHVHTPGSDDASAADFGTPAEIVDAAISAGLDAIAVTDHNTAAWVSDIAAAALDKELIVLPGVEISTAEGHLLAIWEEGTAARRIEDLLARLGIGHEYSGRLDIAADVGFAHAAEMVEQAGGLAIAAHVEKEKGLLKLAVKAQIEKTLRNPAISAVEIVHFDTVEKVECKSEQGRAVAYVRGSDTWDASISRHSLSGIGARRTWIKASRPDLIGLRHAFADPELRVSLEAPPTVPNYDRIERIDIVGGFLAGTRIDLSPDLNCLLGGTGAGKSLVLEAIRFAVDQQVDAVAFPSIRGEIDSRMNKALMDSSVVIMHVASGGEQYRIERTFNSAGSLPPVVFQRTGEDWAQVDIQASEICAIAGFSQGEILEYSRQPVGRMTLIDSSIELDDINGKIDEAIASLNTNARDLIAARVRVRALTEEATREAELEDQVKRLTDLFKTDAVKEQGKWTQELTVLDRSLDRLARLRPPRLDLPDGTLTEALSDNADIFLSASNALSRMNERIEAGQAAVGAALEEGLAELGAVRHDWVQRFAQFKLQLDLELEKIDPRASLTALRASLEQSQQKLTDAQACRKELETEAQPHMANLEVEREKLISSLQEARRERRSLRRSRVSELNDKAAGFVKLDIPNYGDESGFRSALEQIKVGSRVTDKFLGQLALRTHPVKFGRAMWTEDFSGLADPQNGIDLASVAKLFANIDEKDLWQELLDLQAIDRPDVLTIKFKKPDDNSYTAIENLAHGQRCTAILVILLADGDTPVLVDQPEDALHAPWIEEYLVDRLRSLRGSRQYLFATRSPGIVVSGDAEQIVTMKATSGHGEIEAAGSLERHELNRLALEHLEGGRVPFNRRTLKLKVSVGRD